MTQEELSIGSIVPGIGRGFHQQRQGVSEAAQKKREVRDNKDKKKETGDRLMIARVTGANHSSHGREASHALAPYLA